MSDLQHIPAELHESRIHLGISSCLTGEKVRYDGGHKRDRYINDILTRYFTFVRFCPEVAIGLGIPRPIIRLARIDQVTRAVIPAADNRDITEKLSQYGKSVSLSISSLSGYIFKAKSPSCGMERVKIYDTRGIPENSATGIYADAIMQAHPLLPVEEEGRLNDAGIRDNFIERVFIYHRWQHLEKNGIKPVDLVAFHTEHKFLIMAHDQDSMRKLGRLVAAAGKDTETIARQYKTVMMAALARQVSRKNQTNVLQHIAGFLKQSLDNGDRTELAAAIEGYRSEELPIIVPLTLIRHHLRKFPSDYLAGQRFLEIAPAALDSRR